MSIAPIVLAQIGIMRKTHGADRRHDIMSLAAMCACGHRHDIHNNSFSEDKNETDYNCECY